MDEICSVVFMAFFIPGMSEKQRKHCFIHTCSKHAVQCVLLNLSGLNQIVKDVYYFFFLRLFHANMIN